MQIDPISTSLLLAIATILSTPLFLTFTRPTTRQNSAKSRSTVKPSNFRIALGRTLALVHAISVFGCLISMAIVLRSETWRVRVGLFAVFAAGMAFAIGWWEEREG